MIPRTRVPCRACPAALALWALLAAACAPAPPQGPASPVLVTEANLDPDVYRVTVRWAGDAPPADREALLLVRCAELTQQAGAGFFFIVNASAPIAHTAWLKEGAVATPNLVAPEQLPSGNGGILTAVMRVFRKGRAPEGYPLYDAARILHERSKGTALRRGRLQGARKVVAVESLGLVGRAAVPARSPVATSR